MGLIEISVCGREEQISKVTVCVAFGFSRAVGDGNRSTGIRKG